MAKEAQHSILPNPDIQVTMVEMHCGEGGEEVKIFVAADGAVMGSLTVWGPTENAIRGTLHAALSQYTAKHGGVILQ